MKRLAMLLCFIVGATIVAGAQDNTGKKAAFKNSTPEQRALVQDSLMKSRLQLTDDQMPQVSAIDLKYAQKMDPILKSDQGKFAMYRKLKPLMEAKDKELKGVLTPDQYEKYEDAKKEMMEQARSRSN